MSPRAWFKAPHPPRNLTPASPLYSFSFYPPCFFLCPAAPVPPARSPFGSPSLLHLYTACCSYIFICQQALGQTTSLLWASVFLFIKWCEQWVGVGSPMVLRAPAGSATLRSEISTYQPSGAWAGIMKNGLPSMYVKVLAP